MLGTRSKEDAPEARPKYISLYGYLDGALFAPSPESLGGRGKPIKNKNGRSERGVRA